MTNEKEWRFCAVGNIVAQHIDNDGTVYYGSKAYSGGTKVYIYDCALDSTNRDVTVIGLNRFGKYALERVPIGLLENIRCQRVFKPGVLSIMSALEIMEGMSWRGRTADDRRAILRFIESVTEHKS